MKSSGRSGTRSSSAGLNYMFITTRRALTFSGSGGSEGVGSGMVRGGNVAGILARAPVCA